MHRRRTGLVDSDASERHRRLGLLRRLGFLHGGGDGGGGGDDDVGGDGGGDGGDVQHQGPVRGRARATQAIPLRKACLPARRQFWRPS
jgi:hypothetical protein